MALSLVTTGPVGAHTEVLRAEPAPGAVVSGVVDQVTLVFLDPVQPEVGLVVSDDQGTPVPGLGAPVVRDGRTVAEVGFDPLSEPGGYVVEYRFIALDGDIQRQTHRFTYEPAAFAVQPPPAAPREIESTTVVGMGAVAAALVWSAVRAIRQRREGPAGPAAK